MRARRWCLEAPWCPRERPECSRWLPLTGRRSSACGRGARPGERVPQSARAATHGCCRPAKLHQVGGRHAVCYGGGSARPYATLRRWYKSGEEAQGPYAAALQT